MELLIATGKREDNIVAYSTNGFTSKSLLTAIRDYQCQFGGRVLHLRVTLRETDKLINGDGSQTITFPDWLRGDVELSLKRFTDTIYIGEGEIEIDPDDIEKMKLFSLLKKDY